MKNDISKYLAILAWILLFFVSSCKKETAKIVPISITTAEVTDITSETVVSGGEVTNDGGAAIEAKGICWSSINQMPTLWDSKTMDGSGTGSFRSAVTGLTEGTTYYIRAYASNNRGTGYGNALTFKTLYKLNDYLPLVAGAKYKYSYTASYRYVYESSIKKGISTWIFIDQSPSAPQVYLVQESFTGDYIYTRDMGYGRPVRDSIHYENQISTLKFEVQNDGKVAFTFNMPYWGASKVILERFIRSDKTDTCLVLSTINRVCLRKNTGLNNLFYYSCGNHCSSVHYSLIEGSY